MITELALRILPFVVAVTIPAAARSGPQQAVNPTAAVLADFRARVDAYVELHRRLAKQVGEIDSTKSPKEITDREKALGLAIQASRAQAKRGEIFTPEIAQVFSQIIRDEYRRRSLAVRTDRRQAQDELADFQPTVNQIYPTTQPLATFPAGLLKVLPPLPKELEYRLVQRHLILRDIEANLIVDVLSSATP